MIRTPTVGVKLLVGDKPGWELEHSDDDDDAPDLKSVSDSLVVLQSLRQSREKWLTSTFPKFSSKSRGGKQPETVPPPHTMAARGKCDIEIGPHIFTDTSIYEAHYLPAQTSSPKPAYLYYPPSGSTTSWQATTPYGASSYTSYGQLSAPVLSSPSTPEPGVSQKSTTPLLSSVASEVAITPLLIAQVNSAAASNPTLANLLQLAASGGATPEQLKTLGLLIQSLATSPEVEAAGHMNGISSSNSTFPSSRYSPSFSGSPSVSQYASHSGSPPKEFDLVIEFRETPSDRWIFPRAPAVCDRVFADGGISMTSDIRISTCIPFPKAKKSPEKGESDEDVPQQVATFHLIRVSPSIWDSFNRWAGGYDKMEESRTFLQTLKTPSRVYLGHQLPEGPLLTQLQNARPSYSTKALKPIQGDSTKPRRKPAARKLTVSNSDMPPSSTAPTPKRRKPSQPKVTPPLPKIACFSCGQTDVPLIMGGRFCRPCVQAGKASNDVPPASAMKYTYRLQKSTSSSTSTEQSSAAPTRSNSPLPPNLANLRHIPGMVPPGFNHSPLATNPPLYPPDDPPVNKQTSETK